MSQHQNSVEDKSDIPSNVYKKPKIKSRSVELNEELNTHHNFVFPAKSSCCLFIWNSFGCRPVAYIFQWFCCCKRPTKKLRYCWCCCGPKNLRLQKMMESGYEKFSEEMDIVNVLMKIRKHQVAIKSSILCCDEKDYLVEHAQ